MAYRIQGTASHDCKVYIINASTHLLDRSIDVSAGSYEALLLSAEYNHITAVATDPALHPITYSNVQAQSYVFVQPTFGFNLKEIKGTHKKIYHLDDFTQAIEVKSQSDLIAPNSVKIEVTGATAP